MVGNVKAAGESPHSIYAAAFDNDRNYPFDARFGHDTDNRHTRLGRRYGNQHQTRPQ